MACCINYDLILIYNIIIIVINRNETVFVKKSFKRGLVTKIF